MIELKVKLLKTFKDKLLGLINAEKAVPVLINTRFGIHTFGLKFPIDVVILNKDYKVVKISENLKPNKIFLWLPFFNKVIELPKDEVKKLNIKQGSILKLELINQFMN